MSVDEILRTISYCVMIPGAFYVGVRVWNAAIMPPGIRRPVAMFLWLQSSIYALFMIGLFLLRLWQPVEALVWLNTFLIMTQAVMILVVILHLSLLRKIAIVMLAVSTGFILLGG